MTPKERPPPRPGDPETQQRYSAAWAGAATRVVARAPVCFRFWRVGTLLGHTGETPVPLRPAANFARLATISTDTDPLPNGLTTLNRYAPAPNGAQAQENPLNKPLD